MVLRTLLPVRCPGCGARGDGAVRGVRRLSRPSPARGPCPPGSTRAGRCSPTRAWAGRWSPTSSTAATGPRSGGWPPAWPRWCRRRPARSSPGRPPPRHAGASAASTRPSCWLAPWPAAGGSRASRLLSPAGGPAPDRALARRPARRGRCSWPGPGPGRGRWRAGGGGRRRAHHRVDAGRRGAGAAGRRRGVGRRAHRGPDAAPRRGTPLRAGVATEGRRIHSSSRLLRADEGRDAHPPHARHPGPRRRAASAPARAAVRRHRARPVVGCHGDVAAHHRPRAAHHRRPAAGPCRAGRGRLGPTGRRRTAVVQAIADMAIRRATCDLSPDRLRRRAATGA